MAAARDSLLLSPPTPQFWQPPRPAFHRSSSSIGRSTPPLSMKSFSLEVPSVLLRTSLQPGIFLDTFAIPNILVVIVENILSSRDFLSFVYVSKQMRAQVGRAFDVDPVRHRFLAHFVPGYSLHVQAPEWNPRLSIDFTDLELFLESEAVPLSNYPTHALSVITTGPSSTSPERIQTTSRFQTLTLTYSRFVLYLRSRKRTALLHDEDDPFVTTPSTSSERELTFPAPLSYGNNLPVRPPPTAHTPSLPLPTSTSKDEENLQMKKRKRLSLKPSSNFRTTPPPPPPPSYSLPDFGYGSRRHTRMMSSVLYPNATMPSPSPTPSHKRSRASVALSKSTGQIATPPATTASASLSSSHQRLRSLTNFQNFARPEISPEPTQTSFDSVPSSPGGGSLHSFARVFWLARAPVLRVYVPCSILSETVLDTCQRQLSAAGLEPHMRPGDLVINFGYMPPVENPTPEQPADGSVNNYTRASVSGTAETPAAEGWLIWTGNRLIPLGVNIPIEDPLANIPSPFYYSHVLGPTQNPRFHLIIPRAPNNHLPPQFTLERGVTTVISPGSQSGVAKVNTHVWVARFEGLMWGVEWTVEAQGTKEGKHALESALAASGAGVPHTWEFVRERSGKGKIWARLV